MSDRPLVLLSNDDGYAATGINELRSVLQKYVDVVLVAPDNEQSAQSHALTLARPLRHRVISDGIHSVDGTPADCVYVALFQKRLCRADPT